MNRVQYFNYNDLVFYKLGKNFYSGNIVDFYKYANELRIKVQFNIGLFTFPANKFIAGDRFWVVGD